MSDEQKPPGTRDTPLMPKTKHADTLNARSPMEKAALALYVYAARLIKEGKSYAEVEQELTRLGVQAETAQRMLQRIDSSRGNVTRRMGWRNVGVGALVGIAGFSLVVGAFGAPAYGLGALFAWGSVLLGGYWVLRGTAQVLVA